ncbi:MAG TPA: hypothetical protein VML01_05945 [Bryobacterales bacterium]|nr:hypothetical protein [Bryobacterales bacterium]
MTGRSDEPRYLRTVEAEYPAMEFLSAAARPSDRFIGVQNYARSHLPPLNEFFCAGLADPELALPRVVTAPDQSDWNYLIVPNPWRQRYIDAIPKTYTVTFPHRDQFYSVFALSRRTGR